MTGCPSLDENGNLGRTVGYVKGQLPPSRNKILDGLRRIQIDQSTRRTPSRLDSWLYRWSLFGENGVDGEQLLS